MLFQVLSSEKNKDSIAKVNYEDKIQPVAKGELSVKKSKILAVYEKM